MDQATSTPFAMVLGRKTYDIMIMAAHWPHAPEETGAKTFNDATKYAASRNHPRLEWSNSVLIEGDAAEGLAALKQEDGPELQVHGSENLIQTLLRHNLVDEFRLWVFPLVIGSGKRLFAEGNHSLRVEARRKQDLHHGRGDGDVRVSRRDRHRIVRAGLTVFPTLDGGREPA
jgi:dihydrofolate reductase